MIVEDQASVPENDSFPFDGTITAAPGHCVTTSRSIHEDLKVLESSYTHYRCRDDLVQHLWNFYGDQEE